MVHTYFSFNKMVIEVFQRHWQSQVRCPKSLTVIVNPISLTQLKVVKSYSSRFTEITNVLVIVQLETPLMMIWGGGSIMVRVYCGSIVNLTSRNHSSQHKENIKYLFQQSSTPKPSRGGLLKHTHLEWFNPKMRNVVQCIIQRCRESK